MTLNTVRLFSKSRMSYKKCLYTAFATYAPPTAVYGVFALAYGSSSDTNTSGSALGASCSAGEPDRKADIRRKRDKDLVNPCAEFNSLQWRMSYASRKEECNALSSCVFIGRAITGACAPRDPSMLIERSSGRNLANVPLVLPEKESEERKAALRRQQTARKMDEGIDELNTEFQEEEDKQLAQWRFRELMDALDVEEVTQEMALAILREEGMPAVQEFVKVQLANAATEELRFQKASTEAFAKEFLIQVLQNEELPGHFGKMLERIFKDPYLSTGVRQLIYTAIGLDHTFRNSLWLTRDLVTWLLTGTDWMDEQALRLCVYLIGLDETTHATSWLISWAISEPGILDSPTSRGLARSIPLGSEQITEALRVASVDALQSQWAHDLAKATTLTMLQLSAKDKDTAKGESPPPEDKVHASVENDKASSDVQEVSVGGNREGR